MFSIEFAQTGAETVGVEIREANIRKAELCKEALQLRNLNFIQADVRNISQESHGKFDIIICSGILYHLTAEDAFKLIERMFKMAARLVIIDTGISLQGTHKVVINGDHYHGNLHGEHSSEATQEQKSRSLLASWDNVTSFWFTRPSLVNLLNKIGFSSVYESFVPVHMNFGKPGIAGDDRCTFVAVKSKRCELQTSPTANRLHESYPEGSLTYTKREKGLAAVWTGISSLIGRKSGTGHV
jgi:hypothetical protein